MVKRQWTALDGYLVFEITINRDPSDGIPSTARIYCRMAPQDDQHLNIYESRPTPFEFRFRSGCHVRGYLQQQGHVRIDGIENTAIFADINFGLTGRYDDTHFEGLMVACPTRSRPSPTPSPIPPDPPVPPVDPVDPSNPDSPLPIINGTAGELFSYVYVRHWPKVPAEDLLYSFIQYSPSSPPSSSFYTDLIKARQLGRAPAEALAVCFIDGDPPYQGKFVANPARLPGAINNFAHVAAKLEKITAHPNEWREQLKQLLEGILKTHREHGQYFSSAGYRAALERIWQSYFALIITLGYDPALLTELITLIWLAHIVSVTVTPGDNGELSIRELSAAQILELINATIVLPASVFPLPPAKLAQQSPPHDQNGQDDFNSGWIEPYAIGDLQMVRQRLIRYAAGEVARIENVMRGERKEITSKRISRQIDVQEQKSSDEQVLQDEDTDERTSLLEETRKMVAEKSVTNQYSKFTTTYGPPTQATLDGSWTRTTTPGIQPGLDDTTRFAHDILNKTVNRISRSVSHARSRSSMNQIEDSVTSVLDNTRGQSSLRAVYRWLNKVYEAYVVNYGKRLMIEFMVRHPSAHYIAEQATLAGQSLVKPVPLVHWGIYSFQNIEPDNYAMLGARYGVMELEPPPLAQKFVTATLRSGEEKQIAIPAGYCATQAYVGFVSTPAGLPAPVVLVGRRAFNTSGTTATLQPYGEDTTIPISVMGSEPSLSPPSSAQVLVNVEIQCTPTTRTLDQWRIGIYSALMKSYQQQNALYYGQSVDASGRATPRGPARSTLANRQIEQRELKNACLQLLLNHMSSLTGGHESSSSPPSPWVIYTPRNLQFLDEMLEWGEMAYSFFNHPHLGKHGDHGEPEAPGAGDDSLFTSFLQADQARVLLPVQPKRVMAFLYFFSSGMLWSSNDRQAPTNYDDIALVNDLKLAANLPQAGRKVGPSWEVVVPTAMQILEDLGTPVNPRQNGLTLPAEGN